MNLDLVAMEIANNHIDAYGRPQLNEDLRQAILAALRKVEAEAKEEWRPIETAPHSTLVILAWEDWRDGKWIVVAGYASHEHRFEDGNVEVSRHAYATHWRPLPPPPSIRSSIHKGDATSHPSGGE